MKKTNKSGFTLVELSIVLVIIGLLIGGILVGQSLIESAKMQSFIRQVGQYDAAVAVFKDKFGNLPGDNALFGTTLTTQADRGNGTITDGGSLLAEFGGEIGGFWADLSASGLKNEEGNGGVFTAGATGRLVAGIEPVLNTHLPSAKIGTNVGIYTAGTSGVNQYFLGKVTDAIAINFDGGGTAGTGAIKASDAVAIDSKLDDGVPNTGNVVAIGPLVTAPVSLATAALRVIANGAAVATGCVSTAAVAVASPSTTFTSAAVYNSSVASDYCNLAIRMGSSTGVLN